jgi:hypothetical protein
MRWILLSWVSLAALTLTAAGAAGVRGQSAPQSLLVVQKAVGTHGRPVVTLIVEGFVLGRISPQSEAQVEIIQLPTRNGAGAPNYAGGDVRHQPVRWRSYQGVEYSGSGFRFSAINGAYRVVVRGSGVYLFAGGHGSVKLRGSSFSPRRDGTYSIDGSTPRSLPTRLVTRMIGGG